MGKEAPPKPSCPQGREVQSGSKPPFGGLGGLLLINCSIRTMPRMFIFETMSTALLLHGVTISRHGPINKPVISAASTRVASPNNQTSLEISSAVNSLTDCTAMIFSFLFRKKYVMKMLIYFRCKVHSLAKKMERFYVSIFLRYISKCKICIFQRILLKIYIIRGCLAWNLYWMKKMNEDWWKICVFCANRCKVFALTFRKVQTS